jgi:hypothetical protein
MSPRNVHPAWNRSVGGVCNNLRARARGTVAETAYAATRRRLKFPISRRILKSYVRNVD